MSDVKHTVQTERPIQVANGWMMLSVVLGLVLLGVAMIVYSITVAVQTRGTPVVSLLLLGILTEIICVFLMVGFFTLQPNEARVLVLFGEYKGTVRKNGFHWGNPFYSNGPRVGMAQRMAEAQASTQKGNAAETRPASRQLARFKISLRARTLNGDQLKVNDKRGNPIEIAAVVVWRVLDTAQAVFDVDDFKHYVEMQSESALRHLASCYAYDHGEEHEDTLRSNVEEVSLALQVELQERLGKAGVVVEEARLTHLAYAPEIAQAMLRRQQAEAIIAARQKIVQGAVGMVDMALNEMQTKHILELDDERKAAMVSNLMVVLCGESEVHPVINAGTLYS
jgi:regulator of protease activity HflC (stomatin/prohibitin superfamily)